MQGAQTLSRGLSALKYVADSSGATVQQVADALDVQRTVAYRLLCTLVEHQLVSRNDSKVYRAAAGLAVLGNAFEAGVRLTSRPILQALAEELRSSVALLVAEGEEAVAVLVIVPSDVSYVLSFREGSRHPIDRGAAGIAILAGQPPRAGERPEVSEARLRGWAHSFGEVEPNTHGLAVPVPRGPDAPPTCINLITHREDVLERSHEALLRSSRRLAVALAGPAHTL